MALLFGRSPAALVAALPWLAIGLAFTVVQQSVASYQEFYRAGVHRRRTQKQQMFAPYARVVILHVVIFAGAFAIDGLGSPLLGLIALVIFKTGYDVVAWAHGRTEGDVLATLD